MKQISRFNKKNILIFAFPSITLFFLIAYAIFYMYKNATIIGIKEVCTRSSSIRKEIEHKTKKLCFTIKKEDLAKIKNIKEGTFTGANNLTRLYLEKNKLKFISANMLKGLDSLKFLFLSGNSIEKIDSKSFSFLSKLDNLDLKDNPIFYDPHTIKLKIKLKK